MSELAYFLSVLIAISAYIIAGVLLWGAVEGVYRLYCKVRGIKY
jgi:hypothetical protein